MADPNVYRGNGGGGTHHALVNVVAQFAVDNTGATDAGPALQTAFNTLASAATAAEQAAFLPAGTYKIVTPVSLPAYLTVVGTPKTIINQQLVGAGNFSAFNSNPTLGAEADVTANSVLGSLVVQSDTTYAAGTWLLIQDAALLRGNLYQVASSAVAGPNFNLTLDRPVEWAFVIGDTINPVTTMLRDVRIYGNGMLFTGISGGTVAGYIGFGGAYRCGIYDCRSDNSLGSITTASVAFNFDIGSLECEIVRCHVDGAGSVVDAFALQSCERSYLRQCVGQNCTGWTHPLFDCYDCGVIECAGSGSAAGAVLTSNGAAAPGCTACRVLGGGYGGNIQGVLLQYGSSYNEIGGGVAVTDSTSNAIVVDGTVAGCVGNTIDGAKLVRTGVGTGNGALYVAGNNGNELKVVNLTTTLSQLQGISVQGNGASVLIEGWTSINDGIGGGAWVATDAPLLITGTSDVIVKGARVIYTQTVGTNPFVFYPQAGCTLELDDVLVEERAGATNCIIVAGQQVVNIRLRNVRSKGSPFYGYFSNAGVAVQWRFLEGNDFSSCIGAPGSLDATAQRNKGTVVANGVTAVPVPFTSIQVQTLETVKLTPTALNVAGSAYLFSQTPGVGFSIKSVSGDVGTYDYEVS